MFPYIICKKRKKRKKTQTDREKVVYIVNFVTIHRLIKVIIKTFKNSKT